MLEVDRSYKFTAGKDTGKSIDCKSKMWRNDGKRTDIDLHICKCKMIFAISIGITFVYYCNCKSDGMRLWTHFDLVKQV